MSRITIIKLDIALTSLYNCELFNRIIDGMANLLILHGPNLNLLGTREPDQYETQTLATINQRLQQLASEMGHSLTIQQSNAEYELINTIQQSDSQCLIFNPAAFTHTSIALRDALLARQLPFIEVHLSNIYARETFRQHSYFSDIALAIITGCGAKGYEFALQVANKHLSNSSI